jgi:hypothetical protein
VGKHNDEALVNAMNSPHMRNKPSLAMRVRAMWPDDSLHAVLRGKFPAAVHSALKRKLGRIDRPIARDHKAAG